MASVGSEPYRNVLLVGFMGSGKSTVGERLAARLGWDLVDFDAEVEHRTGHAVWELFATRGEAAFRDLEQQVGEEALERSSVVLVSGGGWPVPAGRMEALGAETLSVWLQVDAGLAVARAGEDAQIRPLLAGPETLVRAAALLEARRERYALADLHLDTSGKAPDELVTAIVRALGAS